MQLDSIQRQSRHLIESYPTEVVRSRRFAQAADISDRAARSAFKAASNGKPWGGHHLPAVPLPGQRGGAGGVTRGLDLTRATPKLLDEIPGLKTYLDTPPPPGGGGPFALSEESNLRAFAEAGGLTPLEVADVGTLWHYPDLGTALRGMKSSGVAVKAAEHSGEDALPTAMTQFLMPFRKSDGSFAFGAQARYLFATV